MGFEKPSFSGECYVLEKGLYADPEDWGALSFKMSSIQPVLYVRADFKTERQIFHPYFKLEQFSKVLLISALQDTMAGTIKNKVPDLIQRLIV